MTGFLRGMLTPNKPPPRRPRRAWVVLVLQLLVREVWYWVESAIEVFLGFGLWVLLVGLVGGGGGGGGGGGCG